MKKNEKELVLKCLEEMKENKEITSIVPDYSGRFMYGKECLGISMESSINIILDFKEKFREKLQQYVTKKQTEKIIKELFSSIRTDNFGLGIIVYFPNFSVNDIINKDKQQDNNFDDSSNNPIKTSIVKTRLKK